MTGWWWPTSAISFQSITGVVLVAGKYPALVLCGKLKGENFSDPAVWCPAWRRPSPPLWRHVTVFLSGGVGTSCFCFSSSFCLSCCWNCCIALLSGRVDEVAGFQADIVASPEALPLVTVIARTLRPPANRAATFVFEEPEAAEGKVETKSLPSAIDQTQNQTFLVSWINSEW